MATNNNAPDCAGRNGAHTPGPWFASMERIRAKTGRGTDMQAIADTLPATSEAERKANARLIAAAPEMLEALRKARRALAVYAYGDCASIVAAVDAAIAKAEVR